MPMGCPVYLNIMGQPKKNIRNGFTYLMFFYTITLLPAQAGRRQWPGWFLLAGS